MAKKKDKLPAHSPLGPSSGDRWLYRSNGESDSFDGCPGSVLLTEGMPDKQTEYSALGTAAHYVTEICRQQEKPAIDFLGFTHKKHMKMAVGKASYECDHEMAAAVQKFVDYVNSFPSDVQFFEEKLTFFEWVPEIGFGTVDDIRIDEVNGVCYISDFKYGKGVLVKAEGLIQLMLYGLGAIETYSDDFDFDKIVMSVSQPRLDYEDSFEMSVDELKTWGENVVKPGAVLARSDNAPINPGAWCKFCKVKNRCRTRIEKLFTLPDSPQLLTDFELGNLYPLLPVYIELCNKIKDDVKKRLLDGDKIPMLKLVQGRSSRSWKSEEAAFKAMKRQKFKAKDLQTKVLISPSQFEKLAGKSNYVMKKYVNKSEGSPTVATLDDKREEYEVFDAENEFSGIEDFDFEEVADLEDDIFD